MTTPAAQPQQQPTAQEAALLGALIVVLGSDLPTPSLLGHLFPIFSAFGIPAPATIQAASLALPHLALPEQPKAPGPAEAYTSATEAVRRAEYLVSAARRLRDPMHSIAKERANLARHLQAQHARQESAKRVDEAARHHGPRLGWYAIRDERCTPECRAAHGAVFRADRPPLIGYPGTLHGGTCRCRPGAPHPDAVLTVDEATAAVREHAVIPFAVELSR